MMVNPELVGQSVLDTRNPISFLHLISSAIMLSLVIGMAAATALIGVAALLQ